MRSMTDSCRGFQLVRGPSGYSLQYVLPGELDGSFEATLFGRGDLLDGTEGVPSRIAKRISPILAGARLVAPWQVHGTAIVQGRPIWSLPQRVKADGVHMDALFEGGEDIACSLRFADCTPVVVAGKNPRPWAVILHSGFRGTLLNIVSVAWSRLMKTYGTLAPADTFVWIGPAIGPCCYSRRLEDPLTIHALSVWKARPPRIEGDFAYFDLISIIASQAEACGIPKENIFSYGCCTSCCRDRFYSYRAGDFHERMLLLAKLRPQSKDKL